MRGCLDAITHQGKPDGGEISRNQDVKCLECQGPTGLELVQRAEGGANGFQEGRSCQMPGTVLSSGDMDTS